MSRHALIVGGTRGIGRATAQLLRDTGWRVSVIARNEPESHAKIAGVSYYSHDLLSQTGPRETLQQITSANGPLDVASLFQRHRGEQDSWEGHLASTLSATRAVISELPSFLTSEGDRSIAVVASIATRFVADEQDEGYHAAKAGLIGLMRYYAAKLGPMRIRVNAVSPGTLLKDESKHFILKNRALHELYKSITPLRRMGTATEVAQVIRFLLSSDSSFITGQEIIVDGGVGLNWQESLLLKTLPQTL
jgi:hypothetical protein